MVSFRFVLQKETLHVYPLGSSCFYIVGSYALVDTPGTASFQSWVNASGKGVGLLSVDSLKDGLFFLQTFDSYSDSVFRHLAFGLAGGLLQNPCIRESIEYGSVSFTTLPGGNLQCTITAKKLRPGSPGAIPFYQNYVLTDAQISTNAIAPMDPNSVFRVGSLVLRDSVSNRVLGTNFFENYATTANNRGIGISTYITENQILYSILDLTFSTTIEDPTATVAIRAITPAGQKYMKSLVQGNDDTTLNGPNYMETLTGTSRNIPAEDTVVIDCVLSNLRVRVFFLQPDEPKSAVRLGTYDIINNQVERTIIGTVDFQSYVTTDQQAIGTVVLRFTGREGCIFGIYTTEFDSPIVIEPNSAQVGFTGGQGDFRGLINGYADLETIPFSTDRKARVVYSLKQK